MTSIAKLTMAAGILAIVMTPALAQVERSDPPYERPADRMYDRSQDEVYQGMRTSPTERHQGNIGFVTGGVSKDEANAFRAMMSRYALGLEFAQTSGLQHGLFLANVDVSITDGRGQPVLQTTSDGPFLLANLPAGSYTVRAASEGRVKTQTVTVTPGRHQHLVFAW